MIGIIGAMEQEVTEIKKLMSDIEEINISNVAFTKGKLANRDVVVTLSGIAKVNAAISTTIMMEHFDIEGVINIGTAGGLKLEQNETDIVISTVVAHHDWIIEPFDWPKGFNQDKTAYKADQKYIDIATSVISEKDQVWVGPIASGDLFVYKMDQIEKIQENFSEALCVEMEAAGIAQTCRFYGKPFVVIRSLSDITVKGKSDVDFYEYLKMASVRSAAFCKAFIEKLN